MDRRGFFKAIGAAIGIVASEKAAEAMEIPPMLTIPGREENNPQWIGQKGKKFAMVMDLRKCIGCQACTSACVIENDVPTDQYRTYVPEYEVGTFPNVRKVFLPQLCNHCENPPCVPVCPTGATYKRQDGIVVVDNTICWGCGYCVNACPYDKRFMNDRYHVADKCTFCAHRVDNGMLPACVESCVGGARIFGDLNDPNSEVSRLIRTYPVNVLRPEQGTIPNVFYINLYGELQDTPPTNFESLDDLAREYYKIKSEESEWMILKPLQDIVNVEDYKHDA